jgi:hypothetical protein
VTARNTFSSLSAGPVTPGESSSTAVIRPFFSSSVRGRPGFFAAAMSVVELTV